MAGVAVIMIMGQWVRLAVCRLKQNHFLGSSGIFYNLNQIHPPTLILAACLLIFARGTAPLSECTRTVVGSAISNGSLYFTWISAALPHR
jgi:MFS superfamily sulfate permease-like transporter